MLTTSAQIYDKRLTDLIKGLSQQFSPAGVQAILQEAGRQIGRVVVLQYPPATGAPLPKRYRWGNDGKLHKFKSWHAQRGFFAALRRGKIRIPYPRTGKTARDLEFVVEAQAFAAVVKVSIPTDTPATKHRRYFLGDGSVGGGQSLYFKQYTNWQPFAAQIASQETEIVRATATALDLILKDLQRLGT